jgi:hypothetical protein
MELCSSPLPSPPLSTPPPSTARAVRKLPTRQSVVTPVLQPSPLAHCASTAHTHTAGRGDQSVDRPFVHSEDARGSSVYTVQVGSLAMDWSPIQGIIKSV